MGANVTPNLADKLSGYEQPSGLHSLLESICARLREQSLYAAKGMRVLPEYHGDLMNSLAAVLGKRLSVLAVVSFEACNADHTSLSLALRDIRIKVSVYESVLINQGTTGTKISALTFAEAALAQLHMWAPAATDVLLNPQPLHMLKSNTLGLDADGSDLKGGQVCYTVRFATSQCVACHCG